MNDVHALTQQGGEVELFGTIDEGAHHMWVPISFANFGPGPFMPACPTATLSPVTAFAVELTLKKGDGTFLPHVAYTDLEKTQMYFGDYDLWGRNLYGAKFARLPKLRRLGNGYLAICQLNDTLDLILSINLQKTARRERSEIIPVQRDGSPFPMRLRNVSAEVIEDLEHLPVDSLGGVCPVAP